MKMKFNLRLSIRYETVASKFSEEEYSSKKCFYLGQKYQNILRNRCPFSFSSLMKTICNSKEGKE